MDERVRLTDLKDAEESGITKGIEKGIKKGIETGKKETTIDIVKKMLLKKISIENISEITGLTKKEILNLK